MIRHLASLALALALVLGPGCGGAMVSRRPDPIPAGAATELDTLEHAIDGERERLETTDPAACPDRCRSVEAICDASERICEIAGELGDESVSLRCGRASRACDEARTTTDPSCGCAMASDGGVASCEHDAAF